MRAAREQRGNNVLNYRVVQNYRMVSASPRRDDSQEKKAFLHKPNSPKHVNSDAGASEKSNKTRKSSQRSDQEPKESRTATVKSSETSEESVKTAKSAVSLERTASTKRISRHGPHMSDGTEFDTGPYGYIFSFIYLFVLWGLAIILAVVIVWFHYYRLDPQYPTYFGDGSFLGGVPKATFDPNPRRFLEDGNKILIEWNIYDFHSYVNFLIRYKKVLKNYSGARGKHVVKPEEMCKNRKMERDKACKFDRLTDFGECALSLENLDHGFGFNKGQPCIMLKLNKIVGWAPQLNVNENGTSCPKNEYCCGPGIKFRCSSDDDVRFEFYPKTGIPTCYYPYANQKGYEQPYQMVKLTNITFNKETVVECVPEDQSLRVLSSGKANEARFHILMKRHAPKKHEE